ncbi:MAG: 30S ribosomal protein S8 [Candidatus Micrarchaeaceae archaeon]|jgi:Ribosomal protein S8|nr:30S ribosomal protein S8 [Candidatus Marsarchaeota archaeon]
MVDLLADAINTIKTNERIGRRECIINSTKLIKSVLEVMKKNEYVKDFNEFEQGHVKKLKVSLSNKINAIGIIKPRHAISKDEFQKYESRYILSKDFGILIVSTSRGLLTNKEAKLNNIGGRLILYVY